MALLGLCLILSAPPLFASPQDAGRGAGLTADQWAEQARELVRRGVVFDAMSAYERAVRTDPERLDIRLEYAKLLKTMGFWLRSAGQYRSVLDQRPRYIEAIIGYGELLLAEYQFASAIQEFSRVLDMNPSTKHKEQALVGIGSGQFGLEDYVGAAETFERLLEEVPGSPAGTAFLALTRRKQGKLDEAVELLNRFLEFNPGVNRARIDRIEIQEQMAAIHQARVAAEEDRGNAARWARLGDLKRKQPDLAGARAAYARASELKPRETRYRFMLAVVLRDMGLWKDAASVFASILDDPKYGTTAAYNLAYCERRAGDRTAEAEAWAQVVERHPLDIDSYRRYVEALDQTEGLDLEAARVRRSIQEIRKAGVEDPLPYLKKTILAQQSGDLEAATDAVLSAVAADVNDVRSLTLLRGNIKGNETAIDELLERLEPLYAEADPDATERLRSLRARGGVLLAAGRLSEARTEFEKALELDGDDAPTMVAIAACLRESDRSSEAIRMLDRAVKAEPDYVYAHLDLALTLMKARRWERSIEAARRAIRLDPDSPLGYSIAGASFQAMGRYKEAAEALERAVDLDPLDRVGAPRMILARVYGALGRNQDAIEVLPGDVPEDPEEIYRLAWEFVKNNYLDRTFNGQDWDAWRNRFEGRLKSEPQALGAIALMLASLDDRNTRLRSHDQTGRLLFTPRTTATEFASSGKALSTSKTVDKRHLEGNVGYIAITNLSDPKLPEQIEEAVEEMKTTEGVILDLRGNQGGADREVPKITGMFVKPGTETGKIITQKGTETVTAEPKESPERKETEKEEVQEPLIPEDKPVVVLVDRNTASSAENLAASLKESKRAVVVGEKTHGKAAVQVPKLLPGGATVLVVGAEHADLAGNIYTGVGIDPDLYIKDAAMGDRTNQDESIRKARELITKPKKEGSRK